MNLKRLCASLSWSGVNFTYRELDSLYVLSKGKPFREWLSWLSPHQEYWENSQWIHKLEKEHLWLSERSIELLAPWQVDYPESLKHIKHPPFLSVIGSLQCLHSPSLAIVGSRNPSMNCIAWMRTELGRYLISNPTTIISGGARGVDQEAHRLCVAKGVPTICFLPSGLAKVYPSEMIHWFEQIVKSGGAIVSQFSPFTQIYKSHFHRRNELIAALSRATFVVEAKLRSGSLLTATKALQLGREVATVPSSPVGNTGKGNLKLLSEGAQMIVDAEDLLAFWQRNKESSFSLVEFVKSNCQKDDVAHPNGNNNI